MFPYVNPEAIWNEHRESTRGRDLDITGMSYAMLGCAPQQWPLPEGAQAGTVRLYEDGVFPTPDGRARFAPFGWKPVAEARESRYPFSLNTGRLRDQWHGMSRTGTLGRLFGHAAEPSIELNPQDMARRGLHNGDLVHVTSKRGSIVVPAQGSQDVALGQAFMAMHWGSEYLSGRSSTGQPLAGVNALTTSAVCPASGQPELKHAAVKILKAELGWSLLGVAWLPPEQSLAAREALRRLMTAFPFASCVPFAANTPLAGAQGAARAGVLFRAAASEAPPEAVIGQLESLLGLSGAEVLRYADRKKGQSRAMRLRRHGDVATLEAFLLAGDTRAEPWIRTLLQEELPAQAYGRLLLVPGAGAPQAVSARGRQVCSCFDVSETAIAEHLAAPSGFGPEQRLAALQAALRCGTNCGSCIPELKRLVRSPAPTRLAA